MNILLVLLTSISDILKNITKFFYVYDNVKNSFKIFNYTRIKKRLKELTKYYLNLTYADRINIYLLNDKNNNINLFYECVRHSLPYQRKWLESISIDKITAYMDLFAVQDDYVFNSIEQCPNDLLKKDYTKRNVKSAVLIAIRIDADIVGFVSVEYNVLLNLDSKNCPLTIKQLYTFIGSIKDFL